MIAREALQKKFKVFILLSSFILLIEVAGSIFTKSLALLSDAGHVLVDLLAMLLTYFSVRLSQKKATSKFSYGYYRGEIFSAIINGVALVLITLYIFYESYQRFLSPRAVKGPEMLAIAVIGLLANLYVVLKMHGYERENLNVRGAYLHVLSDTLTSIGVILAAILIIITGNNIFDPLISALIGAFILVSSVRLIKESIDIFMEATPKNIDLENLARDIQSVKGVRGIHDLHVWSLSSDLYALSAHVLVDKDDIDSINRIVSEINDLVKSKYNISHSVIQSECEICADDNYEQLH